MEGRKMLRSDVEVGELTLKNVWEVVYRKRFFQSEDLVREDGRRVVLFIDRCYEEHTTMDIEDLEWSKTGETVFTWNDQFDHYEVVVAEYYRHDRINNYT